MIEIPGYGHRVTYGTQTPGCIYSPNGTAGKQQSRLGKIADQSLFIVPGMRTIAAATHSGTSQSLFAMMKHCSLCFMTTDPQQHEHKECTNISFMCRSQGPTRSCVTVTSREALDDCLQFIFVLIFQNLAHTTRGGAHPIHKCFVFIALFVLRPSFTAVVVILTNR